jgi:hypothetical protein
MQCSWQLVVYFTSHQSAYAYCNQVKFLFAILVVFGSPLHCTPCLMTRSNTHLWAPVNQSLLLAKNTNGACTTSAIVFDEGPLGNTDSSKHYPTQ